MSTSALRLTFLTSCAALLLSACCGGGGEVTEIEVEPVETTKKKKKKKGDVDACPSNFKNQDGKLVCSCTGSEKGSVWGSGIYTTDSRVCAAARHAGAVDEDGGTVTVKPAKGCNAYTGSKKNGVKSGKWGSYDKSYYFKGHGKGKCGGDTKSGGQCVSTYKQSPPFKDGDTSKSYSCTCKGSEKGSVWGTDTYTTDSNICAAARHAGVIDESGGKIKVKGMKGCKGYKGSKKNGVKTSKWGSYDKSFYFTKNDKPKCAK